MRLLACFGIVVFAGIAVADDSPAGRPRIRTLAFSGDGRYLVAISAANDDPFRPQLPRKVGAPNKYSKPPGFATVWELPTGKKVFHVAEPLGIAAAAVSPDGKRLALSRFGADIQIIGIATGAMERELPAQGVTALALAFFGDGKHLATSNDDSVIRLWNVDAASARIPFEKKYQFGPNSADIAISGDGKTLACLHGATVALVELASGKELQVFEPDGTQWAGLHSHSTEWSRVHFTADDRHVVMRSIIGTLAIRERATGKWVFWNESDSWSRDAAVSRDSKWIALSGQHARVLAVDLSRAHETIAKDVRRLAKNWEDEMIAVRDRASKDIVALGIPALGELRGVEKDSHSAEVQLRARLAREAIRSPAPVFVMRHPEGAIERVAISPDAQTLATGGAGGIVRLWSLVTAGQMQVLRQFPAELEIPRREP